MNDCHVEATWLLIGGTPIRISAIQAVSVRHRNVERIITSTLPERFEVEIILSNVVIRGGTFGTVEEASDRMLQIRNWLGIVDYEGHGNDEIWLS